MNGVLRVACLAIAPLVAVWSCSSEPAETAGPNQGGAAGATGASQGSTSSSAGGTLGAGGAPSACAEACTKLESTCGLGPICSTIPYLDCTHPDSECVGNCVLDADCSAILKTWMPPPDQPFLDCLQVCLGFEFCKDCVQYSCPSELAACSAAPLCAAYIGCIAVCADSNCITDCGAANPSPETTALIACGTTYCAISCEVSSG